jgi:transposase
VTTATTIGLDIAKNSFQIHGVAASGRAVLRKQLRRGKVLEFFANLPACLIGMECEQRRASLGTRADQTRPRGAAHATAVREALCEDQQA